MIDTRSTRLPPHTVTSFLHANLNSPILFTLQAMSPQNDQKIDPDPGLEGPPVLGSWKNVYWFVLVLHGVIVILFYLFSQAYA